MAKRWVAKLQERGATRVTFKSVEQFRVLAEKYAQWMANIIREGERVGYFMTFSPSAVSPAFLNQQ